MSRSWNRGNISIHGNMKRRPRPRAARCSSPSAIAAKSKRMKAGCPPRRPGRQSEEHTSELQSLMRISYAVFCLKKKNITKKILVRRKRKNKTDQQTEATDNIKHIIINKQN